MTWEKVKLSDLGIVKRGKSKHRPRNASFLYGGKYPFVQTSDIKNTILYINEYSQTYSEEGLKQSKLWDVGTLCITIAANIAETAILKIKSCFPDSIVGFTSFPDKSDVRFVKYLLDYYKTRFQNISKGTTQDNLSVEKINSLELLAPDLLTQRKIASILSAYDDLIENNTRRIKIIEEMAQTIYKEWFVNFRFPTTAGTPGHDKVKPASREGRFVESPLGRIPEGWEVKKLGEVIELKYGKGLKKDTRMEGEFPVFGSGGIVDHHNSYLVNGPGIILGRKGNVGSVFLSIKNFYPIDTVFYVNSNHSPYYLYYLLKSQTFINTDAAVPGLNRTAALSKTVIFPPVTLIEDFSKHIGVLYNQRDILENKNNNLRKTRDLLLPKLMSGEVPVPA